jgi:UDP-N-acetylmuramoyl-tripeptide--D-alanyl-D-alanine ligase
VQYRLRHIPALLRTPTGRGQLRLSLWLALWPVLNPLAALYRRLVVNRTRVVAVVGSYGKTTTTAVVSSVLLDRLPRTEDNFLSRLAEGILRIRPGDRHAVMEVGVSQPGDMIRYRRLIRPDVVVVTAIGTDHMVYFHSQRAIRAEKALMLRSLTAAGAAVLNGDDPNALWMRDQTRGRVVTYGFGEHNDVRATDVSLADWPDGTTFTLHAAGTTRRVRVRLIGRPMVLAALAAVAVALAEGLPLDRALRRLEQVPPISRRMEPIRLASGAVVLRDCSKGTQEPVEAALDVLADVPAGRRIVVLGLVGDAGADPELKHRTVGRRLGGVADRLVLLCQEYDDDCAAGAIEAGLPDDAITRLDKDMFGAVRVLKAELAEGDVVLVTGWGWLRLERIDLLLAGESVRCRRAYCRGRGISCLTCPARTQGWPGSPAPVGRPKRHPLGPELPDDQGLGTWD